MVKPNEHFTMSEPQQIGVGAKYAFWLTTDEPVLVEFVKTMLCVVHVSEDGDPSPSNPTQSSMNSDEKPEKLPEEPADASTERMPLRVLVTIKDTFDADEAWHWIYSELDEEAKFVRLDTFWEDAINGVL